MTSDIFRSLQERLDLFSVGFPAIASGVEITLLKKLFSEEDANLFLKLSPVLAPAESIAENLGLTVEEMAEYYLEHHMGRRITVNEAVAMLEKAREDGLATLNPDRCIGCGLCLITCPSEALRCRQNPRKTTISFPRAAWNR